MLWWIYMAFLFGILAGYCIAHWMQARQQCKGILQSRENIKEGSK